MKPATRQVFSQWSLAAGALTLLFLAGSACSQFVPEERPRIQIRFTGPAGMKVWFQGADGPFEKEARIDAPGRINLRPGCVYRLKLGDIPNRPELNLYPTLQIGWPGQAATAVAHQAVPIEFTDEDFDRVAEGQLVTKEVKQQGTVLAVLRLGNIDLEGQR